VHNAPALAARRRIRIPIALILALAYLIPTGVLLWVLSTVSTRAAERELDAELGTRLAAIAAAAATQVRGSYLVDLAPGDENRRAHANTLRKLQAVREQTGASRIYVFLPDGRMLVDTAGQPVGAREYQLELDRHELTRMFGTRTPVTSTTFTTTDGRVVKAGYAVVTASEEDLTVVAGLAVEAPAAYFVRVDALASTLRSLALATLLVYAAVSLLVAFLLSRPVRRLTDAAERIGQGDLEAPVPVRGHSEMAFLAATLDDMRRALRQRSERLQMMLAGIAHEVRNPLGGIELYAGILRDELGSHPEQLAHVHKIEREVGHLKQVVVDFLDYARRARPEAVRLDLATLAAEVVELGKAEAEKAGLILELDAAAPAMVDGDGSQLRRALLNLVQNAIQATPRGGRVQLRVRQTGDEVTATVSDTGPGIPSDSQDKIFTPFFTTKEKGTGLGLAFVKEIVADHGGHLSLASSPGEGSTFSLRLPASR
jgi:signal transduction histidine kinase